MLFQCRLPIPALLLSLLLHLPGLTASAAPPKKNSSPPPLNLGAQDVTATLPDPKLPGKLLCEIHAAAALGQSADNGFLGTMTRVWARLYQKGVPAAVLTAPRTQGSSQKGSVVVTATGGVLIKSLIQPGTKLSADKVVWYPNRSTDNVVATGHVFFRDGKTGATMTGPRAVADTNLKTLQIVSGHASATL